MSRRVRRRGIFAAGAAAKVAFVQGRADVYTASATNLLNALANPISAGSVLIVAEATALASTGSITAVTGCGATWTKLASEAGYGTSSIWIGTTPTAGSSSAPTITMSAAGEKLAVAYLELKGASTSTVPVAVGTVTDSSVGGTTTTPALTPTALGQAYIVAISQYRTSLGSITPTSGSLDYSSGAVTIATGSAYAVFFLVTSPTLTPTDVSFTTLGNNEYAATAVILGHA